MGLCQEKGLGCEDDVALEASVDDLFLRGWIKWLRLEVVPSWHRLELPAENLHRRRKVSRANHWHTSTAQNQFWPQQRWKKNRRDKFISVIYDSIIVPLHVLGIFWVVWKIRGFFGVLTKLADEGGAVGLASLSALAVTESARTFAG